MVNVPEISERAKVLPLFAVVGTLISIGLGFVLKDFHVGVVLFDSQASLYPLTIQNLMWLLFFVGLGELFLRWKIAQRELSFLQQGYLPEDQQSILQPQDLAPIRKRVTQHNDGEHAFLPTLIDLCILQFQASRSVDQTVTVLNSQLELIEHRLDLRYTVIKYIIWVVPTVGFIGTVIGIADSLLIASQQPDDPDIAALTSSLGLAFNTTLVSLLLSAVLVLFQHIVQSVEENSLNKAGNYTLINLINRLFAQ